MERDARIYVAGHGGLVGAALLRRLRAGGYANVITRTHSRLDLRRQSDVEAFFADEHPEFVFLAAAKVGGILANSLYGAEFIYDNLMIAANVIHAAHRYGVRKLLNLGSSCIYPKHAPQPLRESSLLTGALEPTNEAYAVAKISAIKLCRYYNEQYGTNFISLMPTNLYGPGDGFDLERAHVLPALMRKFHLAKLLGQDDFDGIARDLRSRPLGFGLDGAAASGDRAALLDTLGRIGIAGGTVTLWGTGSPRREFLYVDDLADACLFLMQRCDYRDLGDFVNVGVGEDITIRDLAALLEQVIGSGARIGFDPAKPDGTPRKLLDLSRMRAMGWEAGTGLEEGIRKTYQWYTSDPAPAGGSG